MPWFPAQDKQEGNSHQGAQHQPKGSPTEEGHPKSHSCGSPILGSNTLPCYPFSALGAVCHAHPSHVPGGDSAG